MSCQLVCSIYSEMMGTSLISEQLTSSLRLNVPGVQAQVFLCFRVILLRMTPLHVTSLWPIIISEMLQVFLQIEQELSTDTEEFRYGSSQTNVECGTLSFHPYRING